MEKMKSLWLTAILLVTFCVFSFAQPKTGKTNSAKPNIVFILADDMGIGDVHCFNPNGKIATPFMDKIAADGMMFTNAHSSSAVCSPSRYSVITGRYAWRSRLQSGVLNGYSKPLIPESRFTVADMLKEQGYYTACIGKWHLGMDWKLKESETVKEAKTGWEIDYSKPVSEGPRTAGFDYFYGISASLDMPPFAYIENDKTTQVPSTTKKYVRSGPAATDFEAENVVPDITQKAKAFLAQRATANKPFFLYFTLPSPHTPIVPAAAFKGKSGVTEYGDYVVETDWAVGQIAHTLDSLGLSENTLLIVTSDNGFAPYVLKEFNVEAMGHYPSINYRGYKSDIWEGGHRVPFIAKWPGNIKAGTVTNNCISLTDFMATCAAITNTTIPATAAEDSYSFLPAFKNAAVKSTRPSIVYHSIDGNFAIEKGKWKLELCPGSGGWTAPRNAAAVKENLPPVQLFDMENDVAEKNNVQAQYPEVVKELQSLLEKYIADGRSTPGKPVTNDVAIDLWKKDKYTQASKE
ncbi:MAG: arylsulfatase [Filimonas sp.]|nr:arylsulfatase [Filimonas sp.]